MNWWQILILCWVCALVGYFIAALMFMARSNSDEANND